MPSTLAHSFSRATSSESFSWIPACAFTISLSAQKLTPSPYGSARPCRQSTISGSASMRWKSSAMRRDFPMPGTPTRVTSCGSSASLARSNDPMSTSSSRVAADERHECALVEVHPEPRTGIDRLPDAHRFGLALRDDGFALLVVDDVARGAVRRLGDEHTVDRRRRL